MTFDPFLLFAHVAGVVVWVGGMFFAYVCLRPEAAAQLEPPPRLRLWRGVLARFFTWVWVAVAVVLASGLALILRYGFAAAPLYQHIMFLLGLVMIAIYVFRFFRALRQPEQGGDGRRLEGGGRGARAHPSAGGRQPGLGLRDHRGRHDRALAGLNLVCAVASGDAAGGVDFA